MHWKRKTKFGRWIFLLSMKLLKNISYPEYLSFPRLGQVKTETSKAPFQFICDHSISSMDQQSLVHWTVVFAGLLNENLCFRTYDFQRHDALGKFKWEYIGLLSPLSIDLFSFSWHVYYFETTGRILFIDISGLTAHLRNPGFVTASWWYTELNDCTLL